MTNDLKPMMGDNQPPLPEALAADHADLIRRRDELIEAAARTPATIEDEATNKRFADFVKQLQALDKTANVKRVDAKEPFLKAGREVDGFFKGITDPIAKVKAIMEARMTTYQRKVAKAERKRLAAEAEAARAAAAAAQMEADLAAEAAKTAQDVDDAIEAEQAAAKAALEAANARKATEAKPAELSRTRGDFGAVASLKTWIDFENIDRATIDLEALRYYLPMDGIEKGVRAYIKAAGEGLKRKIAEQPETAQKPDALLKGCRIFENSGTSVR